MQLGGGKKAMKKIQKVILGLTVPAMILATIPVTVAAQEFRSPTRAIPTNTNNVWTGWFNESGNGCNGGCISVSGRHRGRRTGTIHRFTESEAVSHAINGTPIRTQSRAVAENDASANFSLSWVASGVTATSSVSGSNAPRTGIHIRPVWPQ